MRITKYRTILNEERINILIKEKATNYQSEMLTTPKSVTKMLNDVFELNRQTEEYVYLVAVDSKNKPIGVFEASHGTVNLSFMSPREIFIKALLVGAVGLIIAHNHPSGDCKPSQADVEATKRINEAGQLLNINLLDHIIIGNSEYYSFVENHLLG